MYLHDYLEDMGLTVTEFSKIHAINPQRLYCIFRGYMPSLPTALEIQKATKGYVTCEDIYDWILISKTALLGARVGIRKKKIE
jgi:predicted transcriptional regulator